MKTDLIKTSRVIIVEGKYDKIKLSSIVDATIIETEGFGIFNDTKKVKMLRELARTRGLVILTDSDSAGFVIRNYLKSVITEGEIINLYIPDVFGKEKRKEKPSKEGKLGVEGIDTELLRRELERIDSCVKNTASEKRTVKNTDFFELGLSGGAQSAVKRKLLQKELGVPEYLSQKALIDYINSVMDYEQFIKFVNKIL